MQKPRSTAVIAFVLAFAFPIIVSAAPAKKKTSPAAAAPFAVINGIAIQKTVADSFLKEQLSQGIPDTPELRGMVRDELIRREVVAQAARAKGLDKTPDILAQIELSKQALLIRAYVQDFLRTNPTSEEAVRAEYDRVKTEMSEREFKARHILVDAEDEAKSIITKLNAGEKFEALATQSKDPGSKDAGGDLGWSAASAYVKPFADALGSLQKGKFTSEPVKSEFGYHVILLDDTRTSEPPPFEHVKAQISQHLQQQKIEQLISGLQKQAKIQ